jgi:hypothetical protein
MRVYYMTSAKWGKVILKERRLNLARFGELNDPFELSLIGGVAACFAYERMSDRAVDIALSERIVPFALRHLACRRSR